MKKLKLFFVAMLLSAVAINSYAYQVGEIIDGDELSAEECHGFKFKILKLGSNATVSVNSISRTGDVVIPSSVFDDKDMTFTVTELGCGGSANITSITWPNTLTKITTAYGFPGVTEFRIPATTTVANNMFFVSNFNNLQRWIVEDGHPQFAVEDDILYSNDYKTLYSIPVKKNFVNSDGSYEIREGVETLYYTTAFGDGHLCFTNDYKNNLRTLILPASLKRFETIIRNYLQNLRAFVVKEGNQNLKDDGNGVLLSADGTTLLLYPISKPDTDYLVPNDVTTIASSAFYKALFKTLDLNDVTTLNENSINQCNNLESLSLGNVATMAAKSINNCAKLETITIPAELEDFDDGAIVSCKNLKKFIVEEGNPNYWAGDDGVLYSADKKKLLLYPPGKREATYEIPAEYNVEEIAQSAFESAKITSITIPSTVKVIGDYAFLSAAITSITIPSSVETIGLSSFNTSKVSSVVFDTPLSITSIGPSAFENTANLTSFTWPETVNVIPSSCFGVNSGLQSLDIPDNVTKIEPQAFYYNDDIKSIKVGKGVTSIGKDAFSHASRLENVEFSEPSSVTYISDEAFESCYALTSITLPSSLTMLSGQFKDCINLKEIIVPDGSDLTDIYSFGAPNLEKLTFEGSSNVKTIRQSAFKDHLKLTELHFPNTVTTIYKEAFMGCTNLESITFEGGEAEITVIENAAFAECGLKSFDVPNKVKTISNEAFRNCDVLTTVNLPAVTASVDPQAFKGCSTLTAINVDKANTTYSSSDGILLSKNKEILRIFPMGKANSNFTLLPPSIITIGNYAFYDNSNLTNVTIPNKVKTIGKRAFGLCTNLTTVTLLCDNMISPDNIAQALNEAAFDDGVTTSDEQFSKINLNVRWNLLTQYQNNEYWSQFGTITPSFIDETSRDGGLNKTKAKEEFIAVSDNTVDLLSVDTDDETYVLPTTVKQGDKTYAVSLVGDYLFTAHGSQVSNVKEVVVPGNVEYIGARAFMTDASLTSTNSNVESVFLIGSELNEDLLSTARFELTAEDLGSSTTNRYDEFGSATKIYVRKSAEATYKTAWTNYTDNISYKIPFTQTGEYGTFAREFDVDFSEVNGVDAEKPVTDDPVVIAFTGDGKYNKNGNTFSVHMTSINLGDQTGKDGTYVPAGSGVLMKKYKDTEESLYYQIAETGVSEAFVEGNFMKGITLRPETIGAGSDVKRYYISGGTLHEMTKDTNFKNHKSYMELPADAVPAGAKVMLSFGNWDNEATGIESINANVDDNDNLYNLQGQRVNNAGKGIYIKNGKKILK